MYYKSRYADSLMVQCTFQFWSLSPPSGVSFGKCTAADTFFTNVVHSFLQAYEFNVLGIALQKRHYASINKTAGCLVTRTTKVKSQWKKKTNQKKLIILL